MFMACLTGDVKNSLGPSIADGSGFKTLRNKQCDETGQNP
jgi:hypothetical protein